MSSSPSHATPAPLPAALPWLAAALALGAGLWVAPRVFHHYDVVDCFLNWGRASGGRRPWAIYLTHFATDDCDYPPLVPYLLTLVERARLALHAPPTGGEAVAERRRPRNHLRGETHDQQDGRIVPATSVVVRDLYSIG